MFRKILLLSVVPFIAFAMDQEGEIDLLEVAATNQQYAPIGALSQTL